MIWKQTETAPLSFALLAIIIACALPFILVKSFHQHQDSEPLYFTTNLTENYTPSVASLSDPTPPSVNAIIPAQTVSLPNLSDKINNHATPPLRKTEVTTALKPSATPLQTKPESPTPTSQKPTHTSKYWRTVTAQPGDSLGKIFQRIGLSAKTLQSLLNHNQHRHLLTQIKPHQVFKFKIQANILESIRIPKSALECVIIQRHGDHYDTRVHTHKTHSKPQLASATVRGSLYNTARQQHIPTSLIQQMTNIFAREIDFKRSVRTGDTFSILYEAKFIKDTQVGIGNITALSYTQKGQTHRALRYTTAQGDTDYFTPEGYSMKKAYNRYPLRFSHIGSTFSLSRYHPILHYRRPHYGVDLAAPIGTPIQAVGDGRIAKIDREAGYGNMITIQHNQNYVSLYGHLLRFKKGLFKGAYVKRGDIIGYVGQSGLATAPHCHFEFHVNKQPKNPMTLNLPHADPIPKREIGQFKAKAQQVFSHLDHAEAPKKAKG
ncbi:MAG: peptidoglycan DD-metalloendopeptidase family protein [Legionellaceae bacterium]|nr:peptidoglycan DD-metalloendopeptidase family protein [Legionellaceae bacterium]